MGNVILCCMGRGPVLILETLAQEVRTVLGKIDSLLESADQPYLLYTDGSANNVKQIGGWAYVLVQGDLVVDSEAGSPARPVKSPGMELQAIEEGIRALPAGSTAIIRTDAEICIGWLSWNWVCKSARHRSSRNAIWRRITSHRLTITYEHVRAHSGDKYNEQANRMAMETWKGEKDDFDWGKPE